MEGSKTCPSCGRINPSDAQWCVSCGKNLTQPMPSIHSQAQGATYTTNVNAQGQITEAIRVRTETDEIMGGIWVILLLLAPIISLVGAVIVGIDMAGTIDPENPESFEYSTWALTVLAATSIVSSIIYAVINYKLLKRKNDHIKRETALRAGIIDYFRAKGAANFKEQALASQIATMQSIQSDSTTDDRDHNAILFTILLFIPIVNIIVQLYIAYVLTKFDYKHDRRWHAFTQQAQSAGQELGMPLVLPSWKTLPERSFVIYLILTIFTLGLFWFYWYYCFMKDLNEHFKAQWQFEDQFLRSLQ